MRCFVLSAAVLVAFVSASPHGFRFMGRRGPPPCEVPPFIDDLPEDAKNKVLDIWKNYKKGDSCYEEHGRTREVIDSLSPEDRKKMFKKGGPMPPFLRKAPADVQEQFKAIFKDRSIPFEEKPAKFKELAERVLTGDLLEEFRKFHEKMEEHRAEFEKKVAALSPAAKSAHDKIKKLMDQKMEIMSSLDEDTRDELMELFRSRRGPGGPPPFGGPFGGPFSP